MRREIGWLAMLCCSYIYLSYYHFHLAPCLFACLPISCLLACDLFYLRGVGSEHVSVYVIFPRSISFVPLPLKPNSFSV